MLTLLLTLDSNTNKASEKRIHLKGYTFSEILLFYYISFILIKTPKQFCLRYILILKMT